MGGNLKVSSVFYDDVDKGCFFDLLSVFKGGQYHATFYILIMSLNPHWFGKISISPLQIPS